MTTTTVVYKRQGDKHQLLMLADAQPSPALHYDLVSLPHDSKHDSSTLCLISSGQYYEVQSCTIARHASYFFHNRVSSADNVLMATKFDARFSLLGYFEKAKDKYSPLNQILYPLLHNSKETGSADLYQKVTTNPMTFKLGDICDVNDKLGDDMILYRYNEQKTMDWLKQKVHKVALVMKKIRERKLENTQQTFASSFHLPGVNTVTSSSAVNTSTGMCLMYIPAIFTLHLTILHFRTPFITEPSAEDTKLATEIVCDCLSDSLSTSLMTALGLTSSEVYTKTVNNKRKSDWEMDLEVNLSVFRYCISNHHV